MKIKRQFQCQQCAYTAPSYLGRCPECQAWSSFIELLTEKPTAAKTSRGLSGRSAREDIEELISLASITNDQMARYDSGFSEMNRVLGGGIVPGSYILLGGDPGVGKSTLMLQATARWPKPVLYVAGEESPYQIKLRAQRLGIDPEGILIATETNIHLVAEQIEKLAKEVTTPLTVVIDSVQALYDPDIQGTPGNVSQIRECANRLMTVAKSLNVSIILIGHVTKDGSVSGPKVLEHAVDAVLYFEGDPMSQLRILRGAKNRFGNTQEIGVFEMTATGLAEVTNPSQRFLSSAASQLNDNPGSVIVATMEGTRPILVELQALVGHSTYPSPRRVATGIETNRLHQIIAVLERRIGLDLSRSDVYINVVGGLSIREPAADLGIALAILSSWCNRPVHGGTLIVGELGLTGEIRQVSQLEARLQEATRIGFQKIVCPIIETAAGESVASNTVQLLECQTLRAAITAAMGDISFKAEKTVGAGAKDTVSEGYAREPHDPMLDYIGYNA